MARDVHSWSISDAGKMPAVVSFALVGANEWGFGAIAFLPLAYWLIVEAFETEKPNEQSGLIVIGKEK